MSSYRQLIEILQQQQDMLVVGHLRPDADCLGTMLALYHAFGGAEKGWVLADNDPVPEYLTFLPGMETVQLLNDDMPAPQALLMVDCSDLDRCGCSQLMAAWRAAGAEPQIYCIDHHISNQYEGIGVVEPKATATAEIVAALIEYAELPFTPEVATCLYSGMAADSGCFRHSNTTPRTLRFVANLVEGGLEPEPLNAHLFDRRSFANMRLVGESFNNMMVCADGQLCCMTISEDAMDRFGATLQDCENIVNFTLQLIGVKIGMLFVEYQGMVKISMRSRFGCRVDTIATELGGGGHKQAAACRMPGTLDEIMPLALAAAKRELAKEL